MEWNERITFVRKAAGLTQEQLGQRLGVTRQAVSKWESAQTVPDAVTIARLCEALDVSADYLLLGKEPNESSSTSYTPPDTCLCCGRPVSGSFCPSCGYPKPQHPPCGPRYAILISNRSWSKSYLCTEDLVRYCGFSKQDAAAFVQQMEEDRYGTQLVLRRGLPDSAAQWIASHIRRQLFNIQIVEDCGESEDALRIKHNAMELPETESASTQKSGIGFWGVVGAVIVALLILSFF